MNCITKTKMTKDVIKAIIEIDKQFYHDFDYSDTSWYYTRYNEKNEITVIEIDGKIVGYYLFYTISQDLYNDIYNLNYHDDYNFPETEVNVNSKIYYLPSVLVSKKYRKYSHLLLKSLLKDFLSKEKVLAIALSQEGKRMCEKYMKYIGMPKENIFVYVKH